MLQFYFRSSSVDDIQEVLRKLNDLGLVGEQVTYSSWLGDARDTDFFLNNKDWSRVVDFVGIAISVDERDFMQTDYPFLLGKDNHTVHIVSRYDQKHGDFYHGRGKNFYRKKDVMKLIREKFGI